MKQVDLDKDGNVSWQEHVKERYDLNSKELDRVVKIRGGDHSDLFQVDFNNNEHNSSSTSRK